LFSSALFTLFFLSPGISTILDRLRVKRRQRC
jgi:hypothetical protein